MNKNIIGILALALAITIGLTAGLLVGGNSQSAKTDALQDSIDQILAKLSDKLRGTTNYDSLSLGENLTVTGTSAFTGLISAVSLTSTGTTTTSASQDGIMASDDFTIATGTAKAVYTNSFGPMLCRGSDALLYVHDDAGTFAPSLVFAFGTSTSATGYSVNILASTTVATTTSKFITPGSNLFILGSGESIVGAISDGTTGVASSTYFSRWSAQFDVPCNLIQ